MIGQSAENRGGDDNDEACHRIGKAKIVGAGSNRGTLAPILLKEYWEKTGYHCD